MNNQWVIKLRGLVQELLQGKERIYFIDTSGGPLLQAVTRDAIYVPECPRTYVASGTKVPSNKSIYALSHIMNPGRYVWIQWRQACSDQISIYEMALIQGLW